ncbi:hypothetical protein K388_05552 [Streptomyces sp. KhCrAH-43]|uniref:hypothetical protein n=1 Tax=unclassified Streptomyces TaxID=2593676 RepID=UPI000365BED3|nr:MULTISPECIES: hypothetical protein [unclassified Streptomyces]MYX67388.1 hypothetical protein [Streptomyces sp. SID8373]RAJ53765.1 hypothetical protein K388_05552 [Streptomyces sp. KhCrAH-43]
MQLPEQPARIGQPDPDIRRNADQLMAAINEIAKPTAYRDDSPLPAVGPAPPVPQPGQPPMSQWAVDASGVMKGLAVASLPVGGALWLAGQVDPLALAIIGGAPIAGFLALARLVSKVKNAVEAAPPTVNQHYYGTVTQDTRSITSTTRGVIANTRNGKS